MVPEAPVSLREGEEVEYCEIVVPEVVAPGITRHANIPFGRACIAGSRFAVMDIAALADQGLAPEEILVAYPDVTLEQIKHALAYYRAHPEEIEAEFEQQEHAFQEMERKWEKYVARHGPWIKTLRSTRRLRRPTGASGSATSPTSGTVESSGSEGRRKSRWRPERSHEGRGASRSGAKPRGAWSPPDIVS
jgi:uncharacterized protein (DUF433 family)